MRDPAYDKLIALLHGEMFKGQMALTPGVDSLELFGWVEITNPDPRSDLAAAIGTFHR